MKSHHRQASRAELADIRGIFAVMDQNLLAKKEVLDTTLLEQTGFLIHGFTREEARAAILDRENFVFVVAKENENVVGYATGSDIKTLKPVFQEKLASISEEVQTAISTGRVFYYRHIAKKKGAVGIGKDLAPILMEYIRAAGYSHMVCQIAHDPIRNQASILFHERQGFRCVGTAPDGERRFGVYLKIL